MSAPIHLSPESVEAIADRVADKLRRQPTATELIDAGEVARRLGVSRDWVYAHAGELGAIRLGDAGEGKKPRYRFDPEVVAAIRPRAADAPPTEPPVAANPRRRQQRSNPDLLPIRGPR